MKSKNDKKRKKVAMKKKSKVFAGQYKQKIIGLAVIIALFGLIGVYVLANSNAATKTVGVSAATYNILGQHHDPTTKLQKWSKRKARVAKIITGMDAGIVGMQEVTYINPLNGSTSIQRYDVVKMMRDRGYSYYTGSINNNSPVFWKTKNFTVLSKKEALIVPRDSKGKGPAARYLTHVRLQKDKKKISVFNYHFNQFRMNDTKELEKLKKYFNEFKGKGDHVIFTGDFNGRDLQVRNYTGTWRVDSSATVDHVMASSNVSLKYWKLIGKGKPPASDHAPVKVSVYLK